MTRDVTMVLGIGATLLTAAILAYFAGPRGGGVGASADHLCATATVGAPPLEGHIRGIRHRLGLTPSGESS